MCNICLIPDIRSNSHISAFLNEPVSTLCYFLHLLKKENQYFSVLAD